ncbi:hypothetical protein [Tumebacillus permanentifrigoris]|nr:hypothetical protein [Tumebacillus permanentifrigoris]
MTFIGNLLEHENYANRQELAFDLMILQKVLPKLHGNRSQMEEVLNKLFQFCVIEVESEQEDEGDEKRRGLVGAIHEDFKGDYTGFRYPKSAEKIHAMNRQLERTGYCSFIQ